MNLRNGQLTPVTTGFGMPWNSQSHEEAAKIMKAALEQGANFWNGGIHYGKPDNNSLHLLRYYFTRYPEDVDKVVISIKGCIQITTGAPKPIGSPEGIRASVDTALTVLSGVKKIDIFEMARVDPNTPIETSIQTLADLVKEGKIGGIGLSEVNANTIRKAHAVHPISQVEIELSLFTPDPLHNGIVDTCHERESFYNMPRESWWVYADRFSSWHPHCSIQSCRPRLVNRQIPVAS